MADVAHRPYLWAICKKLLQIEGRLSVEALRSDLMKGWQDLPVSERKLQPLAALAAQPSSEEALAACAVLARMS